MMLLWRLKGQRSRSTEEEAIQGSETYPEGGETPFSGRKQWNSRSKADLEEVSQCNPFLSRPWTPLTAAAPSPPRAKWPPLSVSLLLEAITTHLVASTTQICFPLVLQVRSLKQGINRAMFFPEASGGRPASCPFSAPRGCQQSSARDSRLQLLRLLVPLSHFLLLALLRTCLLLRLAGALVIPLGHPDDSAPHLRIIDLVTLSGSFFP